MKDEFVKYMVLWTQVNKIKEKVFYDKTEAMQWKYSLEEVYDTEVIKITEITEVIA